jgi:Flp pilus assembly pilin Flp
MLKKTRKFVARLHKDESGPNTVEWVLLIIVALVVLIGIYLFVQWAFGSLSDKKDEFNDGTGGATDAGSGLGD